MRRVLLLPYILLTNNYMGTFRVKKMTRYKRLILVLCAMTVLTACGQKGDLYLPEGKALIAWMG